jgi:hypothetical protein
MDRIDRIKADRIKSFLTAARSRERRRGKALYHEKREERKR